MEKIAIITTLQAEDLATQLVQPEWYFNPVQDCNNN